MKIKGRSILYNPKNRFDSDNNSERSPDTLQGQIRTKFLKTHAKSIVNEVKSPDVPLSHSLNPYQGCEHGCIYCYARPSHNYWGYSSGIDFETNILTKDNAAQLLEAKLKSKAWTGSPIMLSSNTDCYQPIEKKKAITRACLEVLWKYKNPCSITTKNALVLRDLDILRKMKDNQLIQVYISINTLQDDIRQKLEPRASSIHSRLRTIQQLSFEGIPVGALVAPVIPGLTDHEILPLVKTLVEKGAQHIAHIILRLNGDLGDFFSQWLDIHYPDRKDKILKKIKQMHGGNLNDSRFGTRMKGQGNISQIISDQFSLAKKIYLPHGKKIELNTALYRQIKNPQMKLF